MAERGFCAPPRGFAPKRCENRARPVGERAAHGGKRSRAIAGATWSWRFEHLCVARPVQSVWDVVGSTFDRRRLRRSTETDGRPARPWLWRAQNTDLDLWVTLILLPVGLAVVLVLTFWR
jgi:hypothetical protein